MSAGYTVPNGNTRGMSTNTITLGAQVGGPMADASTNHVVMPLKKLLARHCVGPYIKEIDEFSFVLRIDGNLDAWNFEGCEKMRINRRHRYITIDIGVPEKRWRTNDKTSLATYLSDCVAEGLKMMVGKLRRSKMSIEDDRLFKDFETARAEYLNTIAQQ